MQTRFAVRKLANHPEAAVGAATVTDEHEQETFQLTLVLAA